MKYGPCTPQSCQRHCQGSRVDCHGCLESTIQKWINLQLRMVVTQFLNQPITSTRTTVFSLTSSERRVCPPGSGVDVRLSEGLSLDQGTLRLRALSSTSSPSLEERWRDDSSQERLAVMFNRAVRSWLVAFRLSLHVNRRQSPGRRILTFREEICT